MHNQLFFIMVKTILPSHSFQKVVFLHITREWLAKLYYTRSLLTNSVKFEKIHIPILRILVFLFHESRDIFRVWLLPFSFFFLSLSFRMPSRYVHLSYYSYLPFRLIFHTFPSLSLPLSLFTPGLSGVFFRQSRSLQPCLFLVARKLRLPLSHGRNVYSWIHFPFYFRANFAPEGSRW